MFYCSCANSITDPNPGYDNARYYAIYRLHVQRLNFAKNRAMYASASVTTHARL